MSGERARVRVRPVIADSWSRVTRRAGLPDALHPRRALDPAELEEVRRGSSMATVLPLLRSHLGSIAEDAEHVMVICDAAGRVLWIEGHPRVLLRADRITFTEGMLWTEDSAGTNAIGTALAIDHAVQVFSAEHFLPEQHAWWCSAAPIHEPDTGRLLGIVDLSGPLSTANPHSLGLVMAAAGRAEDALRLERAVEDGRLRELYLERTAPRPRGGPRALVAGDGRVLAAEPAGWLPRRLEVPAEGGTVALPDGRQAVAERLRGGRGWVLRALPAGAARVARPALRLEMLGRRPPAARLTSGTVVELSLRHAEILALLALHPDGLTAEQLTLHLYGEQGNRISTRAEMSRLRKLLNSALGARPYRLLGAVEADFLDVERRLAAGETTRALRGYHGPLLPESDAPRVCQARDELDGAVRRAAMAGGLGALWAWLQTEAGRDDPPAIELYLRRAGPDDPGRPLLAARLQSLQARWALPAPVPAPGALATVGEQPSAPAHA